MGSRSGEGRSGAKVVETSDDASDELESEAVVVESEVELGLVEPDDVVAGASVLESDVEPVVDPDDVVEDVAVEDVDEPVLVSSVVMELGDRLASSKQPASIVRSKTRVSGMWRRMGPALPAVQVKARPDERARASGRAVTPPGLRRRPPSGA
jgi:hypothetical protein